MSRLQKATLLIIIILIADQILKIWVKTHMVEGGSIPIFGNWFLISFTENEGIAFGWLVGGKWGKLLLSIFRILMAGTIIWYLPRLVKKEVSTGFVMGIAGILAGAIGNIIDSMFYGVIFTDSVGRVAEIFPVEGGYAPFLFGHVVDMLFFPLFEGTFPSWFPIWGGEDFLFFRFIFNIADSTVCISIFYIILFQRKSLSKILEHRA
ncbi:MAG: lipoprotein signal peptidase [Prevotellaceae bacterium]|nr:lipoprotein signal peptidase [Prevotellaceae bacterium]